MFYFRGSDYGKAIGGLSGDASDPDPFARWGNGVFFASIPLYFGIMAIIHQGTLFLGGGTGRRLTLVTYHGKEAIGLGVMYLGLALFMHAHYFWSVSNRFYFLSQILKPIALLTISGSIIYVIVRLVIFS